MLENSRLMPTQLPTGCQPESLAKPARRRSHKATRGSCLRAARARRSFVWARRHRKHVGGLGQLGLIERNHLATMAIAKVIIGRVSALALRGLDDGRQKRPQCKDLVKMLGSNSIQESQPTRITRPIDHQIEGRTPSFFPLSRRFENTNARSWRFCSGFERSNNSAAREAKEIRLSSVVRKSPSPF
jgi:hypothetical protein